MACPPKPTVFYNVNCIWFVVEIWFSVASLPPLSFLAYWTHLFCEGFSFRRHSVFCHHFLVINTNIVDRCHGCDEVLGGGGSRTEPTAVSTRLMSSDCCVNRFLCCDHDTITNPPRSVHVHNYHIYVPPSLPTFTHELLTMGLTYTRHQGSCNPL
jgi:hypothetical protein